MATQILRSEAVGDVRETGLFNQLVSRVADYWRDYQRYQRTLSELDTLSDRELADIGLARGDIELVARQSVKVGA